MLAEQEVYWPKYPTSLVPRGLQSQSWGWGAVSGSKELAGQSLHTWGSVRHSASEDKLGSDWKISDVDLWSPRAGTCLCTFHTSNAQIVKMDTVSSFSWNMNIKSHMYLIVPISTIICQSECIYEVGVIAQWNACLVYGRPWVWFLALPKSKIKFSIETCSNTIMV